MISFLPITSGSLAQVGDEKRRAKARANRFTGTPPTAQLTDNTPPHPARIGDLSPSDFFAVRSLIQHTSFNSRPRWYGYAVNHIPNGIIHVFLDFLVRPDRRFRVDGISPEDSLWAVVSAEAIRYSAP